MITKIILRIFILLGVSFYACFLHAMQEAFPLPNDIFFEEIVKKRIIFPSQNIPELRTHITSLALINKTTYANINANIEKEIDTFIYYFNAKFPQVPFKLLIKSFPKSVYGFYYLHKSKFFTLLNNNLFKEAQAFLKANTTFNINFPFEIFDISYKSLLHYYCVHEVTYKTPKEIFPHIAFLLENKADMEIVVDEKTGNTLVNHAQQKNRCWSRDLLLKYGACSVQPNKNTHIVSTINTFFDTPFISAEKQHENHVVKEGLAILYFTNKESIQTSKILPDCFTLASTDFCLKDSLGNNCLHRLMKALPSKNVKDYFYFLIQKPEVIALINEQNQYGKTALFLLCEKFIKHTQRTFIVLPILAFGRGLFWETLDSDKPNDTFITIVKALLQAKADPFITTYQKGHNCFDVAKNNSELLNILLQQH